MTTTTIYTGDIYHGTPVIQALNVNELAPGTYRFMLQSVDMNIGHSWMVPIIVVKGTMPGPRLLVSSGVHGDELNGARVIQQLFAELDYQHINGCVIGLPQVSPNSLVHINKNWYLSTDGGDYANLNRLFPGNSNGNSAEVHAAILWQQVIYGNIDYAVDLHSQSTDSEYPLFVFADFRVPAAKDMALMIPADQIKDDAGEPGTLETCCIEAGIPAITLELGASRIWQADQIKRGLCGVRNILALLNIKPTPITLTAASQGSFIGNQMLSIRAQCGGYCEVLVNLGDMVTLNQIVARQYNYFGDVIAEYSSPLSQSKVVSISTGATREAGGLVVRLLYRDNQ